MPKNHIQFARRMVPRCGGSFWRAASRTAVLASLLSGAAAPQSLSRWQPLGQSTGLYYRWVAKTSHCVVDVEDTRKIRATTAALNLAYAYPGAMEKTATLGLQLSATAMQTFYVDDCAEVTRVMVSGFKRR